MKQSRYLNVILTVIAVLLMAIVWTNIAGAPGLDRDAVAQTPPGIPNAAQQRQAIADAVKALAREVQKSNKLLEGELRVRVTNASEMKPAKD